MEDTIFTRIINGEIPAEKIYEDDGVIAFLDIHPKMPGHTLVITKKQVDLIWELDDDTYTHLWLMAKKIAIHMGKVTGKRIGVQVDGTGVPHTHVHLIPFEKSTDLLIHPDMDAEPDFQALAEMRKRLALPAQ